MQIWLPFYETCANSIAPVSGRSCILEKCHVFSMKKTVKVAIFFYILGYYNESAIFTMTCTVKIELKITVSAPLMHML